MVVFMDEAKIGFRAQIARAVQAPWFAYLTIACFQLAAMWGVFSRRDLTSGDTCEYYVNACLWRDSFRVVFAWSPLYTAFYGSFLWVFPDPFLATMAHRLAIVLAVTVLFLALARKLLPAPIAWLVAGWWAVLPINFNTLYEIHLFSVIPFQLAALALASWPGAVGRGAALGVLIASSVLVRNENIVPAVVLGLVSVVIEARALWGRGFERRRLALTGASYVVPTVIALGLIALAYERSTVRGATLQRVFAAKHTLNMAQVYAFGYGQRNPDYTANPWISYQELLRRDFGKELPTLKEMLWTNPWATMQHIAWNWRLAPSGFQVLLFNQASGSVNPDYAPTILNSRGALVLSLVVATAWGAGIVAWRRRPQLLRDLVDGRVWGWIGIAILLTAVPLVVSTQRPRPSYLFNLSMAMMLATGLWVRLLLPRMAWLRLAKLMPVVSLAFIVGATQLSRRTGAVNRPLAETVYRLQPYAADIRTGKLLIGEFASEVRAYVGEHKARPIAAGEVIGRWDGRESVAELLKESGATFAYLDEPTLQKFEAKHPCWDALRALPRSSGWHVVQFGDEPGKRYCLLKREAERVATRVK